VRASVLIVVMWASLGLVSVSLLFGHAMTMTYRGADNDLAGRQAQQAIEGAVRYAETLLTDATTPGALPDPAEYLNDSIPVGEATFYLLGRNADDSNATTRAFGLIDESGKINLNIDPTLTGQAQTAALTALATALKKLPGVTDEFIDAIVDWQDADDEVSENGAESETYLRFDPAYACKNGPFESVEELALLNGATRDILSGEDTNLNGVLDENENDGDESEPPDNADGTLDGGILEYVTVFNRESNKYTDSSGTSTERINISNLAQPPRALTDLIDERLGEGRAQRIIQAASAGGALNSPLQFYIRGKAANALSEEDFGLIADALTVKDGDYLYGLVNVNTASETVLACLPGMDSAKAADLVTARLSRGTLDTNYAWVVEVLGDATANTIGPFITGRSSQVTADVAAVGRHGRGYRRERLVIDQSTGTPRIVHRRNLAPLGWALGQEIREELAPLKTEARR
jgi:type II secretory pathway component PulK